jgi:hypothetical protein
MSLALSVSSNVLHESFMCFLAVVSPYKPQTRGPVKAHPRSDKFAKNPQIGTLHSLRSQATSHAHMFTLQASNVSAPFPT